MIWDLPTRLFHWGFAACIIGAFFSGENGPIDAHEYFGLAAFGLIVFRIIWGFIGFQTARFAQFVLAPSPLLAYVKSIAARHPHDVTDGHNPLGGLAVLAILAIMGVMAVTGLWTGDDVFYDAPLTAAGIAPDLAGPMAAWHERLHFLVPLIVIVHIVAIIAHRLWLKEKLVTRMVTGGASQIVPSKRQTITGLLLLALCVGGSLSLSFLTPVYS